MEIRFCQDRVHHCLPCGWEWGWRVTASVLRAEINHSVLSKPSFPWKLQAFSRLQTSKMVPSNKFHPFSFCLGGEVDFLNAFYLAIFPWSFVPACVFGILTGIPSGRDPRNGIAGLVDYMCSQYTCNLFRYSEITLGRCCTV